MTTKILLWLFVLNLGVVFGAGIYEARISVARWIGRSEASGPAWHPEEALRDDTGRRFWVFVTTVPLTLLTLANLWAAWQSSGELRAWWLIAALAALGDRLFTFGYFIPRMAGLLRAADSPEARATMSQWAHLNYVRLALVLVAWLAAMQTFAILYTRIGDQHV
ncbi:MAG TPA: DUF1772 domain-containing protein [Polyangia bacterium]|nr:DUF1772 domain-containing protein [Polyangia bacterium]